MGFQTSIIHFLFNGLIHKGLELKRKKLFVGALFFQMLIRRGKYNERLIFGQMEGFNYGNLWKASSLVLESQEFKNLDGW